MMLFSARMAPTCRRPSFRGFWLLAYVLSVALVLSFVLFEVLDIDGSDMPAPPTRDVARVEPPEASNDMRRASLQGTPQAWFDWLAVVPDGSRERSAPAPQIPALRSFPPRSSDVQRDRRILPRASLDDPGAAA